MYVCMYRKIERVRRINSSSTIRLILGHVPD